MEAKKRKPKQGEKYYFIETYYGYVGNYSWDFDDVDLRLYKFNNCFKTKTEANKKLKLIKTILKQP